MLGDVAETVGADRVPDSVEHLAVFGLGARGVGDQFGRCREVDTVEARPLDRRGGDPHMDLQRTGLAQHPDQCALGVTPHDRVVDDDEALTADDLFERVELEPDAQLSNGLGRLDEGTAHVGVLHQTLTERDA